ncbi:hypothetical protein OH768_16425 [Streptomyces sp. NBC_01622]|uniref:hypothetical protein n=1 Tax=Streptomyces sp. NBC_01622 TaxID=2975903 RepID=UPI0038646E58|nr:hypothetical protein OH768_16425 [Streptomyces sp. NBC_01622]
MTTLLFNGVPGAFRLRSAVVLATPGLLAGQAPGDVDRSLVIEADPRALRGQQDPASLLCALAARELAAADPAGADPFSRGVFISTRSGNQRSVRAFAGALAAGRRSPSTFSAAGYNIVAQSVARELGAKGPSVVLAGRRATLDGALFLAALRLGSGAITTGYAGHCTWLPDASLRGGEGLAVLTAVTLTGTPATGAQHGVVRLVPRELYGPSELHRPDAGPAGPRRTPAAEDLAAVRRVAPVIHGGRVPVAAP